MLVIRLRRLIFMLNIVNEIMILKGMLLILWLLSLENIWIQDSDLPNVHGLDDL